MTAKELIEALSQFPPDTPVVVRGYESGYNDMLAVQPLTIQLNISQTWYYGAHGSNDNQPNPLPEIPMTPVIYLHSHNHLADEDWHDR
ncbi:MAG: hypothetical protein ACOYM4_19595 [Nodosilinea sp.]